jgi:hypothetical protein
MASIGVIVALGATAAQTLLGSALPPGGITEHQGKVIWSSLFSRWVVISVHPASALLRVSEEWTLAQDLMLAKQVAKTGEPPRNTLGCENSARMWRCLRHKCAELLCQMNRGRKRIGVEHLAPVEHLAAGPHLAGAGRGPSACPG